MLWCMRIEYAVRNRLNSEVTTAMNSHRPMRCGDMRSAPTSPGCSPASQDLAVSRLATANQAAIPASSATTIAVLLTSSPPQPWCPVPVACCASTGTVCGVKSSGAPGTL